MQKGKDIRENLLNEYCDVHALAFYLNCSPRRIQQLVRRGVIPKGDRRGEYQLISCIHSYQNHLKRLISHFTGYSSGKGYKAGLKERNKIECPIYVTKPKTKNQDIDNSSAINPIQQDLLTCMSCSEDAL